jgi:hypothetical protein
MKRLAEEIGARESLTYGDAYESARQHNPHHWDEYLHGAWLAVRNATRIQTGRRCER